MSGRGGHQKRGPIRHHGLSSSSSRVSQRREEHRETSAPSGHSLNSRRPKGTGSSSGSLQNRQGGSNNQSRKKETEAERTLGCPENHNPRNNEGGGSHTGMLSRGPSHRAVSKRKLYEVGKRSQSQGEHRKSQGRRGDKTSQDPKSKPSHGLDLRSMEKILQMEPSKVVMKLVAPRSGLREFLDRKNTTDSLTHITLDVLSKACSSRYMQQNLHYLLSTVKDSYFLKTTIPMFVMMLGTAAGDQDKREQSMGRLKQIMDLYTALMSTFPSSTFNDVSMAMVFLERELTQLQQAGCTGTEDVQKSLANLQRMVADLKEKKRDGILRSDGYSLLLGDQDETGVENFMRMSVFPTYKDLHGTEDPFLRPNIVKETFRDSETYVDTHFRLLREDFVKPLRDGISHLLRKEGKVLHHGHFDDIRIYSNARILSPLCTPKGILYQVQFDVKNLKMVNWESSKRLLFGALVCLSVDSFKTMIFATVADRNMKDLKEGVTTLSFTEESRLELLHVSPNDSFLMVETIAFFEAYRHVLEGLQKMSEQGLPMQKYIVHCEKDISPPGYLLGHRHDYNFQMLMKKPLKSKIVGNILDPNDWPSQKDLGLDNAQMKAVQLALTKELAIIQGPPGTGKTFIGLKIVKALLDNASIWRSVLGSPILVVCYTNHALDQFLEGILRFMKKPSGKLVRVGGRSSSEKLKELSLTNLRKMNKLPRDQRDSLKKLRGEREKLEKRIGQEAALLESSGKGVLQESVLEGCIRFFHRTRLEDGQPGRMSGFGGKRTRSLMLDWLGISMLIHGSRQMEILDDDDGSDGSLTDEISDLDYLARATEVLSLAEPMEDEDVSSEDTDGDGDMADMLQVTEEAEQVQAERMMEGDNMHKHIQNARRRLAATQRLVLAYVAGEDQEKEEEGKPDDYDEGWEITPYMKKKLKNMVNLELQKKDHMLEGDARRIMDLWTLPNEERWSLYRLWLSRYQSEIRTKIHKYDREYQRIVNRMEEVWNFKDETLLQSASVIGMTTTCAARNRRVLQNIQPRIVVVEEAAEVLEAHIVTTLTSACQHLILIGDHQQLRPSCTVYELATTFKLEVSLFERLIHMDVPYVRLDSQHRMRPEISRLLTPHIYKNLKNHVSVNRYENIKGVLSNVFFIDHSQFEEHIQEGHSHKNIHEATFVKGLCYYMICQGYEPSQITVLTTYTGQLHCLKKIMTKSEFRGVLLSSVDRYQGEENDIIILSLVRSNKEGKTGFLKIPNRVCVALSRAKKGLFCIGNMTMLSSVPLWSKIINTLRSHEQVGEALMLRCENHPATLTPVSKEEDFHKVPLGGCELPCVFRLACGHVCTKVCHPADMEHKLFKCVEPCPKTLCQDGHRCPKRCHQECGECQVLVTKTIPRCGHKQKVPCSLSPDMFTCRVPCDKMLACGHKCIQDCGETCTWNCPQKVTVDLACGHQIVVACYIKQKADSNGELFPCMKRCKTKLDCGHPCPGNCFQCKGGTVHLPCASACDVQLICSHLCPSICGQRCAPCSRPCDNLCYHKKCPKPCAKACEPCTAPCGWCCKHHRCALLCHQPCDRPPCDAPCRKRLKCKHSCIGMCGEPCPKKCRICNADEVTELFFGNEADPEARFVQLEDCKHIFEVKGLDSWMASPEENGAIRPKVCPKCQTAIRRSVRYGVQVKTIWLDIEAIKRKAATKWGKRIQSEVKEREEKGIKSPKIPPLLYKLPMSDLGGVAFISKQIKLLSTLVEIKNNVRSSATMRHLEWINRVVDICSEKITTAKYGQLYEYEIEVEGILCLAEAEALSDICTETFDHWKMNKAIETLRKRGQPLAKQDVDKIKETLIGVANKINPLTKWKMTEDTEGAVQEYDFLKLSHWYKCTQGHICYRQSADSNTELCPQCLMRQGL